MRKNYKVLTLFSFLALALTGCGKAPLPFSQGSGDIDVPWKDFTYPITKLDFGEDEEHVELHLNDETNIHEYEYEYEPIYANPDQLTWESSKPDVAVVEDGVVTAVGVGSTVISVGSDEEHDWQDKSLYVDVGIMITDFAVGNVTMDYDSDFKIVPTFTPADTTYTQMEYSIADESVATITNGVIHSNVLTGEKSTTVTATSPKLGVSKTFTLTVKTIDVTGVSLELDKTELELNKTTFVRADVAPAEAKQYYYYKQNGITYTSSDPSVATIDELGTITAKAVGTTDIVAHCGDVDSSPVTLTVFEVVGTALDITDDQGESITTAVNLNNKDEGKSSIQLGYAYTTNVPGRTRPTRANPVFSSSDENVVTVDQNGLVSIVGKGSARINIVDSNYSIGDYIDVNVTIYCTGLTLVADKTSLNVNETVNLSVTTTPASGITSSDLVYSIPEGKASIAELVQTGNTATLKALDEGTVTVTATWDGQSDSKEFTFTYDDTFYDGTPYIVGSAAYNTGVSTPVEGGSWDKAHLASAMTNIGPDPLYPNMSYQGKSTIKFAQGDTWKARFGEAWRDVQPKEGDNPNHGAYAIDRDGSSISWNASGDMTVTDGDRNILVNTAGSYDIYYKIYDQYTDAEWWEVYVCKSPVFHIDPAEVSVDIGGTVTVNAKNYDATYTIAEDYDKNLITVTTAEDVITITAAASGISYGATTTINATDNKGNTATCKVTIDEKFQTGIAYVVGDHDYHDGKSTAVEGGSWGSPSKALRMVQDTGPFDPADNPIVKQFIGTIEFKANDLWKIRVGENTWRTQGDDDGGYEKAPDVPNSMIDGTHMTILGEEDDHNIKVLKAGSYDIFYKEYQNNTWSVWVRESLTIKVDPAELTVDKGASATVTVSQATGTVTLGEYDTNAITVTPANDGKYTITGKEYTASPVDVAFTDESGHSATCSVTVAKAFTAGQPYVVGSADYSTGISTTGASWNNANKANVCEEIGKDPTVETMKTQYHSVIKFNKDDEWKIRVGDLWIGDTTTIGGEYEIDKNNSAITTDGELMGVLEGGNIVVNTAGVYDIYIKVYTGQQGANDWWSVWVGKHTMSFKETAVTLAPNEIKGVELSGALGDVEYTVSPALAVTFDQTACSSTLCKFTAGTTEQECTITATDEFGQTAELKVTITSTPIPTTRLWLDFSNVTWWTCEGTGGHAYVYLYSTKDGSTPQAWPGLQMTFSSPNFYYVDIENIELYDAIIFTRIAGDGTTVWNRTSKDGGIAISPSKDGWANKNCWKFRSEFGNNYHEYDDGNYTGDWTKK